MARLPILMLLALSSVTLACGEDAKLMESCEDSADCEDGLTCADKGDIAGLCTKPCSTAEQCRRETGSDATYCQTLDIFFCAQFCDSDQECPTNHCKQGSNGGLFCIP